MKKKSYKYYRFKDGLGQDTIIVRNLLLEKEEKKLEKPKNIKKANSIRWISGAEIVKEYERKVALKLVKLEGDKFVEIKKKKL